MRAIAIPLLLFAFAMPSNASAQAIKLQFPVLEESYDITEGWVYSQAEREIHGNEIHEAVDIAAAYGSPVLAAHDGYAIASYEMHWQDDHGASPPASNELDCDFRYWTNPQTSETAEVGFGVGFFIQIYDPVSKHYSQYVHLCRISDKIRLGAYFDPQEEDEGCFENHADGHKTRKDLIPRVGMWVERGEIIGYVGNSGLCFGRHRYHGPGDDCDASESWDEPHLHFAVYDRKDNGTGIQTDKRDPYGLKLEQSAYPNDDSDLDLSDNPNVLWDLDDRGLPKLWVRAPENIRIEETPEGIQLTWNAASDASRWLILRSTDADALARWKTAHTLLENANVRAVGSSDSPFFIDSDGVFQGFNYYYAVAAQTSSDRHSIIGSVSEVAAITPSQSYGLRNDAQLVDEIPGAGVFMLPNQSFTKTFTFKNTGNTGWTYGTALQFLSGDRLGAQERIPLTATILPDATTSMSTVMTAPDMPGDFVSYWTIVDASGQPFGERVMTGIVVPYSPQTHDASYVTDVNYPDGTIVQPGESFTKKWAIRNSGTTTWINDGWVFDGGEQMGAPAYVPVRGPVNPGEEIIVSVPLVAPATTGSYRAYFRMSTFTGYEFGDRMWAQVRVGQSSSDGIVDDVDSGFHPNDSPWWFESPVGFNDHMSYTFNAPENDPDGNTNATWDAELITGAGSYRVFVYVPSSHGTTRNAIYEVHHNHRISTFAIDQSRYFNEWVYGGTFEFGAVGGEHVYLGDVTGELPWYSTQVAFDAVKFVPANSSLNDGIVDELDAGFERHGAEWWFDSWCGYGSHALYTFNTIPNDPDGNVWGIWRPELPRGAGVYRVYAHVPRCDATSSDATYEVAHAEGSATVRVDQSVYFDSWALLGAFRFLGSEGEQVKLVDITSEPQYSRRIAFDAMRWEYVGP